MHWIVLLGLSVASASGHDPEAAEAPVWTKAAAIDAVRNLAQIPPSGWQSQWHIASRSQDGPQVTENWRESLIAEPGVWIGDFITRTDGVRLHRSSTPAGSAESLGWQWSPGEIQFFDGEAGVRQGRALVSGLPSGGITISADCPPPFWPTYATEAEFFDLIPDVVHDFADAAEDWDFLGARESDTELTVEFLTPWGRRLWMTLSREESPRLLAYGESCEAEAWAEQCGREARLLEWRTQGGVTLPWRMEYREWWNVFAPDAWDGQTHDTPGMVAASVFERVSVEPLTEPLAKAMASTVAVEPGVEVQDDRYDLFYNVGEPKLCWGGKWFVGPVIEGLMEDPVEWLQQARPVVQDASSGRPRDAAQRLTQSGGQPGP